MSKKKIMRKISKQLCLCMDRLHEATQLIKLVDTARFQEKAQSEDFDKFVASQFWQAFDMIKNRVNAAYDAVNRQADHHEDLHQLIQAESAKPTIDDAAVELLKGGAK